ncbi:hypothetical protein BZG36_04632 [Bifiguratus adelaidae]|uniref:Uncharacterized protein n=1 Tax=Bifiguratus adelaidae TaxID=1938954 RepID=A0A261XUX7_9FUNG|nr:hypothetical protein BZG36_04632 [Bifiguratus adelaidae]
MDRERINESSIVDWSLPPVQRATPTGQIPESSITYTDLLKDAVSALPSRQGPFQFAEPGIEATGTNEALRTPLSTVEGHRLRLYLKDSQTVMETFLNKANDLVAQLASVGEKVNEGQGRVTAEIANINEQLKAISDEILRNAVDTAVESSISKYMQSRESPLEASLTAILNEMLEVKSVQSIQTRLFEEHLAAVRSTKDEIWTRLFAEMASLRENINGMNTSEQSRTATTRQQENDEDTLKTQKRTQDTGVQTQEYESTTETSLPLKPTPNYGETTPEELPRAHSDRSSLKDIPSLHDNKKAKRDTKRRKLIEE